VYPLSDSAIFALRSFSSSEYLGAVLSGLSKGSLSPAAGRFFSPRITLIDVPELKIFPCEGNISRKDGNSCGLLKSKLKDKDKNPSGEHRCWASLNNKTDELWKISKELFESDVVIFFSSVRWGQANMYYQNLIERLSWIENRHTTLGESNIVKDIDTVEIDENTFMTVLEYCSGNIFIKGPDLS
jgi:hypothetical protein